MNIKAHKTGWKMSIAKFKYVGHTAPIHDAAHKVTGALRYGSDMILPRMAVARFLLSPVAHAEIEAIDTSDAEALPGVIKVFTHLNSPSKPFSRYRILPQQETAPEDEVLFTAKARFVGDRIAAVAARDVATARKALKLIRVTFRELAPVTEPAEALKGSTPDIHASGNLIQRFDFEIGAFPGTSPGDLTTETMAGTAKVHHAAIEPHGCLADFQNGKLLIYAECQGAFGIRTIVADLLGLPYSEVRVIKVPMGGSFGGRQEAAVEPVTAFMAYDLKRPVKLVMDRRECILSTSVRPATRIKVRTVFSSDGRLKSFQADALIDAGGYATSTPDYAHAMKAKVPRLYRIPHYGFRSDVVYTNTPVGGGIRGWGGPEMLTASEIHMDRAAGRLNIDPVALRLKNIIAPYDTDPVHQVSLGDARIEDCLKKGAQAFRWTQRRMRKPGTGRFRRGIGMAAAAHKNGMYGGFPEHSSMMMKMNEDGTFILNTGLHEMGCGTLTSIGMIAAEVLDISPDRISVTEADTQTSPYDFGSYGSRVTYICGAAAHRIAGLMKEKILESAAGIAKKDAEGLILEDGTVRTGEGERLSFRQIATRAKVYHNTDIMVSHTYHGSSNPGVYAAHFAEVEADLLTGMIRVTDYLAAHDVGQAINPGMCEGQIQGAVQMGIGHALYEHIPVDRRGAVRVDSFKDYHLVNAPAMPDVKTLLIEGGKDDGPFGAKSIGEIALVPVAAAVVNAVNHALGTFFTHIPVLPETVLTVLGNQDPGEAGVFPDPCEGY